MTLENWENVDLQWDSHSGQVRALDARGTGESARIIAALTSTPYGHSISLVPDADAAIDLGSATNRFRDIYASSSVRIGTTVASTGEIRLPNSAYATWRNAANTGDVRAITVDGNNVVDLAANTGPVGIGLGVSGGSIAIGLNPADAGGVRLPNDATGRIQARNAANSGNVSLIQLTSSDIILLGDGNNPAITMTGSSLSIGTTPATSGLIRIPNGQALIGRNVGNTANKTIAGINASDQIVIDAEAIGTTFGGVVVINGASLAVGATPATIGAIRVPNNSALYARNAANSGNVDLIYLSTGDVVGIGTGSAGVQIGTSPATSGIIRIPNATSLVARNAANSTDMRLIELDSSNNVFVSASGQPVVNGGTLTVQGASISVGTTPSTAGAIRIPNSATIHSRNAANTGNVEIAVVGGSNEVQIGDSASALWLLAAAGTVDFRYAVTALGGGAAPTVGTIGGGGPAAAAQNSWLKIRINGTDSFIPIWR